MRKKKEFVTYVVQLVCSMDDIVVGVYDTRKAAIAVMRDVARRPGWFVDKYSLANDPVGLSVHYARLLGADGPHVRALGKIDIDRRAGGSTPRR